MDTGITGTVDVVAAGATGVAGAVTGATGAVGGGLSGASAMRAVMQHNLLWFNHYIFGDPLPDFANPVVPKKEKKSS